MKNCQVCLAIKNEERIAYFYETTLSGRSRLALCLEHTAENVNTLLASKGFLFTLIPED